MIVSAVGLWELIAILNALVVSVASWMLLIDQQDGCSGAPGYSTDVDVRLPAALPSCKSPYAGLSDSTD